MPYTVFEQSEDSGLPLELFQFTAGANVYTYTSLDVDVSYSSKTFVATPGVEVDSLVQSVEREQTEVTIVAPFDLEVAQLFVPILPPTSIELTIFRRHFDDSETVAWWNGLLVGANFKTGGVELRCVPIMQVFAKLGVRRLFQPQCNHMLYDADTCRVDPALFSTTGAVTVINTEDIHIPVAALQPDGYYTGGFARRVSNGDFRFIVSHVGETLGLWAGFDGMITFEDIEIFAGCDHVDTTCLNKFNNLVNCGCWPTVPVQNPAAKKFA